MTAWLGSSDSSAVCTRHHAFAFLSLQTSLNGKKFNSLEDYKRHLKQFIAQKDKKFWEHIIMKLPERWQKVVKQNSEHIVQ